MDVVIDKIIASTDGVEAPYIRISASCLLLVHKHRYS